MNTVCDINGREIMPGDLIIYSDTVVIPLSELKSHAHLYRGVVLYVDDENSIWVVNEGNLGVPFVIRNTWENVFIYKRIEKEETYD